MHGPTVPEEPCTREQTIDLETCDIDDFERYIDRVYIRNILFSCGWQCICS